jgi:hypothetical protein
MRQLDAHRRAALQELRDVEACIKDMKRDLPVFKPEWAGGDIVAWVTPEGRLSVQREDLEPDQTRDLVRWFVEMISSTPDAELKATFALALPAGTVRSEDS